MHAHNAIGHAVLLTAGMANMHVPASMLQYREPKSAYAPAGEAAPMAGRDAPQALYAPWLSEPIKRESPTQRWMLSSWVLLRDGASEPALAAQQPSYGRSQLGAVVHFTLDSLSGHRPRAHLRGSVALDGAKENEAALGLSARPIPDLPLRLYGEARVQETALGSEVRGAAFAVTEFAPLSLPAGFEGETYLQAGYVTGRNKTGFVDGQARITSSLIDGDDFRLGVGGGAWGGAQEGASRFDIGPSAGLSWRLGQARARVSADYRFRVAGEAAPSSGPAVTISAGF